MNNIKKFTQFNKLNEALGYLQELDRISDDIIKDIQGKDKLIYKAKIAGKDIELEIIIEPQTDPYNTFFGYMEFKTKTQFLIVLNSPQKEHLIHELKHIHRIIVRNYKTDYWFYLNQVAKVIAHKYEFLFKDKQHQELLIDTFYFCSPDEFETHFHHLTEECKLELKNRKDENSRLVIQNFLTNEEIFRIYKLYNDQEFDIIDFFINKGACQIFLDEFLFKQHQFLSKQISKIDVTFQEKLQNTLRLLTIPDKIQSKSVVRDINHSINKVAKTGYKKLYRLFLLAEK